METYSKDAVEQALADMERLAKGESGSGQDMKSAEPGPASDDAPAMKAAGREVPTRAVESRPSVSKKPLGARIRSFAIWTLSAPILFTLPVLSLVLCASILYSTTTLSVWVIFAISILASALFLAGISWIYARKLGFRPGKRLLRFTGAMTLLYTVYTLLYISAANVKTEAVGDAYGDLHPILRVAVSTMILVDGETVITDATRTTEDYAAMGLPANENSLHFEQEDGYVHALDLRTTGRSTIANLLVTGYFEAVGLQTLRHTGTADHLHVSLPIR